MVEKQPYPWKLNAEELSSALKAASSEMMPMQNAWLWGGISLAGLSLLVGFLWWQSSWIQTENKVMIPQPLPGKTLSLQILPSPNRYALWAQAFSSKQEEKIPSRPVIPLISSSSEFPAILLNKPAPPPPDIPVNVPLHPSSPLEEPTFNLIGIAQGTDGVVATVKVKEGNTEEIKDVRQGAPLLPGYTVTQIAEEYLLLKVSKGGKTIRVD
jgi:hypothetical protein